MPSLLRTMDMTIRTSTAPEALIPAIRQHMRAIDLTLPLPSIMRADARLASSLVPAALKAGALLTFAAISVASGRGGPVCVTALSGHVAPA